MDKQKDIQLFRSAQEIKKMREAQRSKWLASINKRSAKRK